MRTENIGDATLILGDCLEVLRELKDNSVDAIVTDPPYSSGGFTRGDRTADTSSKYQSSDAGTKFSNFAGDNRDQRSWTYWMCLWLGQALRVSKPGAMLITFTDWRQLPSTTDAVQSGGWVWRGIVVWDKLNARPMPNRFRAQAEYIVWSTNGSKEFDTDGAQYHPGVFQIPAPATSEREHSTQKPTELMDRLVIVAKAQETVLDPFMGSGSTGVSCFNAGRKFVGIEQTQHYFDVACRRLEEAWKNRPRLFEEKAPEPTQDLLFQ